MPDVIKKIFRMDEDNSVANIDMIRSETKRALESFELWARRL